MTKSRFDRNKYGHANHFFRGTS